MSSHNNNSLDLLKRWERLQESSKRVKTDMRMSPIPFSRESSAHLVRDRSECAQEKLYPSHLAMSNWERAIEISAQRP